MGVPVNLPKYRAWDPEGRDEEDGDEVAGFDPGHVAKTVCAFRYGGVDGWEQRMMLVRDLRSGLLYEVTVRRQETWEYIAGRPRIVTTERLP